MLLEQLRYGELLFVRCLKSRHIIITPIRLLLLVLNAESRAAALQEVKDTRIR